MASTWNIGVQTTEGCCKFCGKQRSQWWTIATGGKEEATVFRPLNEKINRDNLEKDILTVTHYPRLQAEEDHHAPRWMTWQTEWSCQLTRYSKQSKVADIGKTSSTVPPKFVVVNKASTTTRTLCSCLWIFTQLLTLFSVYNTTYVLPVWLFPWKRCCSRWRNSALCVDSVVGVFVGYLHSYRRHYKSLFPLDNRGWKFIGCLF